jgi:hypothetical protein
VDYEFEKAWKSTLGFLDKRFDQPIDLQAALFLIGVQELGQGPRKYKKDEKVQLMHVAICTLLQHYGYYEFIGRDDDGWPHFKRNESLPHLQPAEQELMVKKAIVKYFKDDV